MISFRTARKNRLWPLMVAIILIFVVVVLIPYDGFPFESRRDSRIDFDKGSRSCLVCHDGTLASNVINRFGEDSKRVPSDHFYRYADHPVGIDYRLAQLRSKGRLKDPSTFEPAIKLENGYVACTSCHNPDSQHRAKLVMSNSGSRLCLSCHNI